MTEFCRKIFPKLEENFNDPDYLNGRVILAPTNNEVAMLNSRVLKMLPGEVETFRSGDELAASEDLLRFNMEFLNSLQPNGFPPFELQLKPGMPLMLLRNLPCRVFVTEPRCSTSEVWTTKFFSVDLKVLKG